MNLRDYHERTKHSLASVRSGARGLDFDNQPLPFKIYPDLQAVPLPTDLLRVLLCLGILLSIIGVASSWSEYLLLGNPFTEEEVEANDSRQRIVGLSQALIRFISARTQATEGR
jgi:hypothetical protein